MEDSDPENDRIEPGITKAILLYISRQSYVCTLIVMMVSENTRWVRYPSR